VISAMGRGNHWLVASCPCLYWRPPNPQGLGTGHAAYSGKASLRDTLHFSHAGEDSRESSRVNDSAAPLAGARRIEGLTSREPRRFANADPRPCPRNPQTDSTYNKYVLYPLGGCFITFMVVFLLLLCGFGGIILLCFFSFFFGVFLRFFSACFFFMLM